MLGCHTAPPLVRRRIMRRFYGLLALVVVIAGCGGSSANKAVKAASESSTTDATVTPTTAAAGATGATGPTGAAGAPGAPGGPGLSGYEIVRATKVVPPAPGGYGYQRQSVDVSASCPAGKSILSGGGSWTVDPPFMPDNAGFSAISEMWRSSQVDAATWSATFSIGDLSSQTGTFTVTIACAFVS
jgi:hypothetical protein